MNVDNHEHAFRPTNQDRALRPVQFQKLRLLPGLLVARVEIVRFSAHGGVNVVFVGRDVIDSLLDDVPSRSLGPIVDELAGLRIEAHCALHAICADVHEFPRPPTDAAVPTVRRARTEYLQLAFLGIHSRDVALLRPRVLWEDVDASVRHQHREPAVAFLPFVAGDLLGLQI